MIFLNMDLWTKRNIMYYLSYPDESQYKYGETRKSKTQNTNIIMAESHWLINSKGTEVKRFQKNNKSVDGVFEYIFVDTGKILGILGKEPPVMTTTVSVDIDLAREIYERLLSKGWRKTEEFWTKKNDRI